MIELYARLIIMKRRAFSKVPAKYQDAVEAYLLELGYDTNGDPIDEE